MTDASGRLTSATANLDDTRPINEQASSVTTLVRPLMGSFPKGFDLAARAAKSRANSLLLVQDEKALLDQLLRTSRISLRFSQY